jgi:hypothetical protein
MTKFLKTGNNNFKMVQRPRSVGGILRYWQSDDQGRPEELKHGKR